MVRTEQTRPTLRSRLGRFVAAIAAATLATSMLATVTPSPAHAVTEENSSFYVNANDLDFILRQIHIAEAHDQRSTGGGLNPLLCASPTDTSGKCVPDPKLPFGLRTVDGSFNNLLPGRSTWGAADQPFEQMLPHDYREGTPRPPVAEAPGAGQDVSMCAALPPGTPPSITPTCYSQYEAGSFVYDAGPRIVSNLIVDQTTGNPAAVNAADNTDGGEILPDGNIVIPNTAPDEGLSAQTNTLFAFFGQFFDHGLDLVNKGGNGTIIVPLQPDDPLYVAGSPTNFLTLTRAERGPGADGIIGTVDDTHNNQTTPFVDQNQTYTSHPSHQFFLREFDIVDDSPHDTGRLLDAPGGGLATWADVKRQAVEVLGIELTDDDVLNVPMIATDLYGNFIPGENGYPLIVTEGGTIEGNPDDPISTTDAIHTNHAFLDDIAHGATPLYDCDTGALVPQQYDETGEPIPPTGPVCDASGAPVRGELSGYDNVTLDEHFVTGDGRGNENVGLTAIHHVFHSEHNRMTGHIQDVLAQHPELDKAFRGLDHAWPNQRPQDVLPGPEADDWSFERRLFQAARFVTEMQYQHLVFEEFARTIQPGIEEVVFNENSYNADVNPSIPAEFAHVVYRFGHSMMTQDIARQGFGTEPTSLLDGFLNPRAYDDDGELTPDEAAGSLIMGTADQPSNQIDEFVVDTLRNELLGLPLDLATINLLRARDVGVPSLQEARRAFFAQTGDSSLAPYTSWTDFGNNLKNGNIFGRGGNNASLVNFVAAYGTHDSILEAQTVAEKRRAAALLVNGAPLGMEFITRLGGANRYATAALISQYQFDPGVPVAYVASGVNFPDALAGGPAAAMLGGPILLTPPTGLAVPTIQELTRLNPGRIVVLGGTGAVSSSVMTALGQLTDGTVTRLAGSDRYATAAAISSATFAPGVDVAYIAAGTNFPDALAGAAAASGSAAGGPSPVLLTATTSLPQATRTELARLQPDRIVILGGTGVVTPAVAAQLDAYTTGAVDRLSGANRYETAVAISEATYPGGAEIAFIATGANYPDALTAAPVAGLNDGPLLLVPSTGAVPQPVLDELERLGVQHIVILGGLGAVSAEVELQLAEFAPPAPSAPDDRFEFMSSTGAWAHENGRAITGLDDVEFWIGGLAERLNPFGGMLGSTFNYVFEETLEDLQFGDRLYYLFRNQGNQLFAALEANSMASLIERNTDASNLPANIFHVNPISVDVENLPSPLPEGFSIVGDQLRYVGEDHVEFHGSDGDDNLRGDQGDDSLWGRDGDDRMEGGSGNDFFHGGLGDDIITDSFGDDEVRAGLGNDAISGGPGFDLLIGGGGHDFVRHAGDIATVFLGDGNDYYLGGQGRANLFGGEGDDWMEGGQHADLVQGDNANQFQNDVIGGNDVVIGGGGDDDIEGEGGDDILVAQRFGTDRHLGNMGWDWVTYYGETAPVDADMSFTVLQRPDVNAVRDRFDQVEALSGGAGDDVLRGPSQEVEGEFLGDEEYLHKMLESTLDLVTGLRDLLQPAGANFAQNFMREGPVIDTDGFPSILLGGAGSDRIEGRFGDDFLDGDAYLRVQIGLLDENDEIIERQDSALAYAARIFSGAIDAGDLVIIREIVFDDADDEVDVAIYEDVASAYAVTHIGDGYWRVQHTGIQEAEESTGTDVIHNFEMLQFSDGCVALDESAGTIPCAPIGQLTLTWDSPLMEGQPVVAELTDLVGDPFDLSEATNVVYTWWAGEGNSPTEITEWEIVTIGGVPADPGTPHRSTFLPDDIAVDQYLRASVSFEINGVVQVVGSNVTTETVENVNDVGVAPPIIFTAPIAPGSNLTVSVPTDGDGTEGVALPEGPGFEYEWQVAPTADTPDDEWVTVEGPTTDPLLGSAYAVQAGDAGMWVRVVITYTDDLGTDERVISTPVGPVAV